MRAALRRSSALALDQAGETVRFGNVEVNLEKHSITVGGEDVHLTPNEYRLLQVLLKNSGKVLTQRQLMNEVWVPNQVDRAQGWDTGS